MVPLIQQTALLAGNDVASLFSHFGDLSGSARYRECVREKMALDAARRWPMLDEVLGIRVNHIDLLK
jgi:hypothetical protein